MGWVSGKPYRPRERADLSWVGPHSWGGMPVHSCFCTCYWETLKYWFCRCGQDHLPPHPGASGPGLPTPLLLRVLLLPP